MNTYVALFRGINVGGSGVVSMKDLKLALEREGCMDVQTYIQSGNVVFRSGMSDVARLAKRLEGCLSGSHGICPRVLLLTSGEFGKAAAGNPFTEADENPKSLHLLFLAERPRTADLKGLEALKSPTERFVLKGRIFYLYTPEGFGRSKLPGRAEKLLGVAATARNWRTVTTLLAMAKAHSPRERGGGQRRQGPGRNPA